MSFSTKFIKKDLIEVNFNKHPKFKELVAEIKATGVAEFKPKTLTWHLKPTVEAFDFLFKHEVVFSKEDLKLVERCLADIDKKLSNSKIKRVLAKAHVAPAMPELCSTLKFVPRDFQWVPVHYARAAHGRFILADQQGLGKSVESVLVTLLPEFKDKPVLIGCPPTMIGVWRDELMNMFGFESVILNDLPDKPILGFRFHIVPYSRFSRLIEDSKKSATSLKKIKNPNWFLIFDEAHMLKHRSSNRTKVAKHLASGSDHILLLTGTPPR